MYEDKEITERCKAIYNNLKTQKPDEEYNNIETWFKYEEDVRSITICARTLVKGDLLHILSVLAEIDIMAANISMFDSIDKLANASPFRWLVHTKIKMPFPLKNRDLQMLGFGIIDQDNDKQIMMPLRSLELGDYLGTEIFEDKKFCRIFMNFGFFHIEKISDRIFQLTNCYNVDPKVMLPWFILNTFIKKSGYYIMDGIRKQIANDSSKPNYLKRIEENKEFYDNVKRELPNFASKN